MKTLFSFFLFLALAVATRAASTTSTSFTTQTINIPAGSYTLNFGVEWTCDDYPQNSAPGRIELLNGSGAVVGRVVASVYRPGNISVAVTAPGTVTNTSYWMATWASGGPPADGQLTGTWNITGVAPGSYTLRFYNYATWETTLHATTVWTNTFSNGGSVPSTNQAPAISWNTAPGTVASGQAYTISAHGHDADGNLAQVNIWRDGQPYAFAGGGNGSDGDSGNPSTDTGPRTVTYTAQAVDAAGAMSAVITQTVTVAAPNRPPVPAISIDGYASGQAIALPYGGSATVTVRFRATDPDGNLSGLRFNIWNSSTGSFDNGGGGFTAQTGGTGEVVRSVVLNTSGTWYFWTDAADTVGNYASTGAWTAGFSLPVTIASNAAPTIAWTSAPSTAANGQSYTISAHGRDPNGNLTQVNVWKNGQPFAFAGGGNGADGDSGNPSSDPGPQSVTYTAQAVDGAGALSSVITHTITIAAPPPVQFALTTVAGAGGSVTAGGQFTSGSTATVTATPDTQHDFTGWSGDANGTTNPLSLLMDRVKTVQANFGIKNFMLTTSTGGGGSVSSGGTFPVGTAVTVTATPDSQHIFGGWTGDATGSANPITVTVDRSKAVQAVFALKTFVLTAAATTGGTVAGGGSYSAGTNATLTATPAANYGFSGWSGDASGMTNPLTLAMTANKNVQAVFAAITYTLTTVAGPGGSVSPGGTFGAGSNATITATPDGAHDFAGWTGDAAGTGNPVSIPMNGNKAVQATFSLKSFALTTTATGGGSVTPGGSFTSGSTATITATPDAQHDFAGWSGDAGGTANPLSLLMDRAKSVQATFALKNFSLTTSSGGGGSVSSGGTFPVGTAVTVTATPDSQHTFTGWTGDATGSANPTTVTLDRSKSVQAVFALKTFVLTATATAGGTVSGGGSYSAGTNATVTATPAANYGFAGWSGDASGMTNPLTLAMTANKNVQAVFAAITYTLTTVAGPGGSVSPGGTFGAGSNATITATPDGAHDFAGWTGDAAGTGNPVSIPINGNKAVQANFSLKSFALTTTATSGGSVTPGGSFTIGSTATVTATPDSQHDFVGWSGDAGGTANPLSLLMDRAKTVQANFALKNFTLTTSAGSGGSVSNGGTYPVGTAVPVTATPDSQHIFSGWTGDATGSANPITVTLDRSKSVQAVFALKSFVLTATATAGGTVAGGGSYSAGTNATVTAIPTANFSFAGWSGDASGTANPLTIVMTADKNVQAVFAAITYTLTTSAGPGGSVSPGGTFGAGSTATITAMPDGAHDFAGWTGNAAGTANPLSLLMNGNKAVQANFSLKVFSLTTSATSGGSVTPGGSYPSGTVVTVAATPDPVSRFTGWAGDATGTAPSVAVTMTAPRVVQAVFASKTAQTISFTAPGDHPVSDPPFALAATATSGLPLTYAILSGPAVLNGGQLQLTGPGAVTVQASQPGNALYLAAPSVTQVFNAVAPVVLKYLPGARTVLQGGSGREAASILIEKP